MLGKYFDKHFYFSAFNKEIYFVFSKVFPFVTKKKHRAYEGEASKGIENER